MANVKKGQSVPSPQWWKHLRKFAKRQFWKRQRKADVKMLRRNSPSNPMVHGMTVYTVTLVNAGAGELTYRFISEQVAREFAMAALRPHRYPRVWLTASTTQGVTP